MVWKLVERMRQTHQIEGLDWEDWRSHLKHAIRTEEALRAWIEVTPVEVEAIRATSPQYRWQITPYYASLMDPHDPKCPIRRQAVPSLDELKPHPHASVDPVGDRDFRKTRRVVHKYPDRIILLVTEACPVYCRHCTRKYHTTDRRGTYFDKSADVHWKADFAYIEQHSEIRDVLLTGGDPLTLPDAALEPILKRLRAIPHVEVIRIGSRYPVLLPQRITSAFCEMLDRYQPIWLNTHFNHPKELTDKAAAACDRLLRHGVPVQNQTVLLKGINDDADTLQALLHGLLKIRVRPYYLYHCDNVVGVSHFATSLTEGRALMQELRGYTTGFAVPQYVLTTPLGKIPLDEDHLAQEGEDVWVTNYKGKRMALADFVAEL